MSSVLCERPATCGQTSCPQYLRPVCATNGRTRRTFSNQCAVRTFNECSNDESKWPRPIIGRKSFSILVRVIWCILWHFHSICNCFSHFRIQHLTKGTLLNYLAYASQPIDYLTSLIILIDSCFGRLHACIIGIMYAISFHRALAIIFVVWHFTF